MVVLLVVLGLVAAFIDARQRIIPNWISLSVAVCGVVLQIVRFSVRWVPGITAWLQKLPLTYHVAMNLPSALGCLGVALVVLIITALGESGVRKVKGEMALGFGDIKYIAAWACTLGWLVLPALALACLLGAAYALAQGERHFAFGPWLSIAFIGTLVFLLFIPAADLLFV